MPAASRIDRVGNSRIEPYPSSRAAHELPAPITVRDQQDQPNNSGRPASYHDIELEEVAGEVPCYENASVIRRKLNKLITDKTPIPGTNKPFSIAALARELNTIAQNHHPVKTVAGYTNKGPSPVTVGKFLKKSGAMAGGDSQTYYYGNMLLEKMRIWNDEKKTKAREKAEEEFPLGHARFDPATQKFFMSAHDPITYGEVIKMQRRPSLESV